MKEFGTYGSGEGQFDCLAGVAVNRIGQFIIADRYNHRIQVLDPSGRFLRAFGSQGTADGRFNYPWGITTDALGFIYVCDKENHRVQVSLHFQPKKKCTNYLIKLSDIYSNQRPSSTIIFHNGRIKNSLKNNSNFEKISQGLIFSKYKF